MIQCRISKVYLLFFFKMMIKTITAIAIVTARIIPKMTPNTIPSVLHSKVSAIYLTSPFSIMGEFNYQLFVQNKHPEAYKVLPFAVSRWGLVMYLDIVMIHVGKQDHHTCTLIMYNHLDTQPLEGLVPILHSPYMLMS